MASYTKVQSLQSDSLSRSVPRFSGFTRQSYGRGFTVFLGHPFGGASNGKGKKRPMVGEWKLMDVAGTKNGLEKMGGSTYHEVS